MRRGRGRRSRFRQTAARATAQASTSPTRTPGRSTRTVRGTKRRISMPVLTDLVDALTRGAVKVVDLTQPLGPATPVIGLPPIFGASPGVTIDVISRYDEKGPAWYWNTLRFGEHTGTHFDAPIHWVTGKDLAENAWDTIPARRFVGTECVIAV